MAGIPASTISPSRLKMRMKNAGNQSTKGHHCIQNTDHGHEYNGLLYPFILPGSVVKPQHGLGAVGQAVYRHGNDLPDRVDYGHDSHIEVAAKFLEHGIIHDLYETVGDGHGKPGHTQAYDAKQPAAVQPHGGRPQLQDGPPAGEEGQDPQG